MKFTWSKYLILLSVILLILGGCSQKVEVSAEEIIHNAIESEKEVINYLGKADMKFFEGEELTEHILLEEYVADEKKKVVTIDQLLKQRVEVLNDGETMLMYDETNEQALEMDVTEFGDLAGLSPKEQFKTLMESMQDSHTYKIIGEEKVLDFDTYHIEVKAKEADNLLGDIEVWVDQKTWFVVKTISETGDTRTELEYTELDFSPKFAKDTFTLDTPDNIEITDLAKDFGPDTVTVEEAETALGQAFLMFSEETIDLASVQMYGYSSELNRSEVELMYHSKDGIPMFSLSIFPTPEGMGIEETDLEIRGNAAEYEEVTDSILWDEDGLRYSIVLANPDADIDEVAEWTENMILSSER